MRVAGVLAAVWLFAVAGRAYAADDLNAFLAAFSSALEHKREAAAAKMTRFPLKNEVYREPKTIAASGFHALFGVLGAKEFADCLKSTKPQRADSRRLGEWVVDCNGNELYFARFDGAWRFSAYENINE